MHYTTKYIWNPLLWSRARLRFMCMVLRSCGTCVVSSTWYIAVSFPMEHPIHSCFQQCLHLHRSAAIACPGLRLFPNRHVCTSWWENDDTWAMCCVKLSAHHAISLLDSKPQENLAPCAKSCFLTRALACGS